MRIMVTLAPIALFAILPQQIGKMQNLTTVDSPSQTVTRVWHVSDVMQEASTLAHRQHVFPAMAIPLIMLECLVRIAPRVTLRIIGRQNIVGRTRVFHMKVAVG